MSSPDQPRRKTAKELRAEQQPDKERELYLEALKWASAWGAGAVGVTAWAQYRFPSFRRMRIPYKVFTVFAVFSASFFATADQLLIEQDKRFYRAFSTSVVKERDEESEKAPLTWDSAKAYVIKNRFQAVGTLWASALGTALVYNFMRRDIAMAQKLINSRMVAQSMALVGFAGLAGAASVEPEQEAERRKANVDSSQLNAVLNAEK